MGRRIRYQKPDTFYFVTNRCQEQKFLLRPDDEMNRIIRGCLARAAYIYDIELVAWMFMSNHFHLIVRASDRNLDRFMEQFQGQLASRLNRHRGRSGTVFPRRYSAEPILDDAALRERIGYTLNNPVEAGLVPHPEQWPGVSSYSNLCEDKPMEGRWLNKTKEYELLRKSAEAPRRRAMEHYELNMTYPPEWNDLPADTRKPRLLEIVESYRQRILESRRPTQGFIGRKVVRQTDWDESPDNPKDSDRPLCHASSKKTYNRYQSQLLQITHTYRQASHRYRHGQTATFPAGTTPPGWRRCLEKSKALPEVARPP